MTDLVVADNTESEVATLVDLDTFTPLPIVAAGDQRLTILQAFRDSLPFDIAVITPDDQRALFQSFLERLFSTATEAVPDAESAMEPPAGAGDDAEVALAELEAVNAESTPPAAPADPDQPEHGVLAMVKVQCWNCNGKGVVEFGGDEPPQSCNMCGGNGWVERPAA